MPSDNHRNRTGSRFHPRVDHPGNHHCHAIGQSPQPYGQVSPARGSPGQSPLPCHRTTIPTAGKLPASWRGSDGASGWRADLPAYVRAGAGPCMAIVLRGVTYLKSAPAHRSGGASGWRADLPAYVRAGMMACMAVVLRGVTYLKSASAHRSGGASDWRADLPADIRVIGRICRHTFGPVRDHVWRLCCGG